MTGTSEADRVALMQRAWDAYNAGEVDAVIDTRISPPWP